MNNVKFGISHFSAQNTPRWVQIVGNYCLIAASIGTTILAAPETLAQVGMMNIILPVYLITTGKVLIGIGVFGKIFTKLFGEVTSENTTTLPEQTQPVNEIKPEIKTEITDGKAEKDGQQGA
jgi:hypothetical protein